MKVGQYIKLSDEIFQIFFSDKEYLVLNQNSENICFKVGSLEGGETESLISQFFIEKWD